MQQVKPPEMSFAFAIDEEETVHPSNCNFRPQPVVRTDAARHSWLTYDDTGVHQIRIQFFGVS